MSAILSATIYIADYDAAVEATERPARELGNSSKFTVGSAVTEQSIVNYQDPKRPKKVILSSLGDQTIDIDAREWNPKNIALKLWGTATQQAATAITGEAHVVKAGAITFADRIFDKTHPVVIKKGATAIDTDDYTVLDDGIGVQWADTLTTAGLLTGDAVTWEYTPVASVKVEALTKLNPIYTITVSGINAVDGTRVYRCYYKCQLAPTSADDLINEDFLTNPLKFTILEDDTITSGSKFFRELIEGVL